jgi:hypothetical protein
MPDRYSDLQRICETFGVDILYVFGSRAGEVRAWMEGEVLTCPWTVRCGRRGEARAGRSPLVYDKVRLAIALEDFFDVHRVDLVSLDDADPFLAVEIIRGERLYARDKDDADEYDLYVLRRAGDLAPLERERIALILGEAV